MRGSSAIGALWADRHPGALAGVVLNAPWLELQGSSLIRNISMHLVEPIAGWTRAVLAGHAAYRDLVAWLHSQPN